MRRRGVALALAATCASWWAAAQAPTPVAERFTTDLGRTTRVSLFSNRVVVVSIKSETDDFVQQTTLEYDEYMVYLTTLKDAADKIGDHPVISDVGSPDSMTRLVIHVGDDAPRIFSYSPLSSLDLSLGRIVSVMNDIEQRALNALPGEYEINHWEPAIGDCVKLRAGGEACVTRVEEDGTIELRRNDIVITYTVAKENRIDVILQILEPEP